MNQEQVLPAGNAQSPAKHILAQKKNIFLWLWYIQTSQPHVHRGKLCVTVCERFNEIQIKYLFSIFSVTGQESGLLINLKFSLWKLQQYTTFLLFIEIPLVHLTFLGRQSVPDLRVIY